MDDLLPVAGFDGYWLSVDGRLFSTRRGVLKEMKATPNRDGYLQVNLFKGGPRKAYTRGIHVLMCVTFHGPKPAGQVARHLDGNQLNNHKDNVAWGTHQDNSDDRERHGRVPRGAAHPATTGQQKLARGVGHGHTFLTEDDIRGMRQMRDAERVSFAELGRRFSIDRSAARRICERKTWGHVQ